MVKFSENDRDGYVKVREVLRDFSKQAPLVIEARLRSCRRKCRRFGGHVLVCIRRMLNAQRFGDTSDATQIHGSGTRLETVAKILSGQIGLILEACLHSLAFSEMNHRQNDITDPAATTCTWLSENEKYLRWLNQRRGLLWIKGKPGAGKSTLLKHALQSVERERREASVFASFFFHGRGASIQKTTLGFFQSLLHQLAKQIPDVLANLTLRFNKRCETEGVYGKWNWHEGELQSFFKAYVPAAAQSCTMFVYIDALDECGEEAACKLVDFLADVTDSFAVCFTCRHYPLMALKNGLEISVEDENTRDINTYIKQKIDGAFETKDFAGPIQDEISGRSSGVFQWVALVVERVRMLGRQGRSLA